MVESQQVLEWMAQGKLKGRRDGEADGRRKGELQGKKDTLLLLSQERFGTLDSSLIVGINGTDDPQRLNHWLSLILKVESLETFRATAAI